MAPIATSGIASQAWRLLEMSPISSFEDGSEQSASAAEQYPVALDMCLERHDWSFARRVARLSQTTEASDDDDLPHVYLRPGDLVAVQEVRPKGAAWRLDGDRLRSDQPGPLWVRYTRRITDENHLPGLFRTAVSYTLAGLLAPRWTASRNRAEGLLAQAESFVALARTADRNTASAQRYDGRARVADWTGEATR